MIKIDTTYYKDVTKEWLNNVCKSTGIVRNAKYVIKNHKKYYVNNVNKIKHKNHEYENALWFVNTFGGIIEFLPIINEEDGIKCSDYLYIPANKKSFFIEEKETHSKGNGVFYHALEGKEKQAKVFLIDCTDSYLSDNEY